MASPFIKIRRSAQWFARCVWNVFAIVGISTFVYTCCFCVTRISSGSMAPTLQGTSWESGDLLLSEKLSYRVRNPRRWEVVLVRAPDSNLVVKRVVGLPGESIQLPTRGCIKINGEKLSLPNELSHLEHLPFGNVMASKAFDCGVGYYLLGDDSLDSDDSRFNGAIGRDQIVGRAWLVVAPKVRRGRVNF